MEILPDARLDVLKSFGGKDRAACGRHKDIDISQQIELHHGLGDDKMRRSCELLRDVFTDKLAWQRGRKHVRRIKERNSRYSLAMAAAATAMAK